MVVVDVARVCKSIRWGFSQCENEVRRNAEITTGEKLVEGFVCYRIQRRVCDSQRILLSGGLWFRTGWEEKLAVLLVVGWVGSPISSISLLPFSTYLQVHPASVSRLTSIWLFERQFAWPIKQCYAIYIYIYIYAKTLRTLCVCVCLSRSVTRGNYRLWPFSDNEISGYCCTCRSHWTFPTFHHAPAGHITHSFLLSYLQTTCQLQWHKTWWKFL